jgi:plasmid maintenance system antidote protein VapI|tara:strand:+ start:52 stop:273 length:222 start_codon:yes stop_codon:yes gene_type:complete
MTKAIPNKGVKKLRQFMKKNDKNQNEISYMVDISPEHASRVMSGKYKPSLELAVKFKKACGIPPEAWLDELEA